MPKSWETVVQCAVKEFQKATATFYRSQALVDKLVALEEDNKVIQSLMVKVPGIEALDPDSTPTLRAGLEDITIRFRKECHAFYIHHEREITARHKDKLPGIAKAFQEKIYELAAPFGNVEFTCSTGNVSRKSLAIQWTNIASASFNRQVNQFQAELIERQASRTTARSARFVARDEAAKQADEIRCEEAIFVLVHREVAKSVRAQEQRLHIAIKPLQDQLAQLINMQSTTRTQTGVPVAPAPVPDAP